MTILIAAGGAPLTISGCVTVRVHPLQGQTAEQVCQNHEACFDETHTYWKQTGAALFLPMTYIEKNNQNRAYEECMLARGYAATYRDRMGYRPDVEIQRGWHRSKVRCSQQSAGGTARTKEAGTMATAKKHTWLKRGPGLAAMGLWLLLGLARLAAADVVELKNGQHVDGTFRQTDQGSVTIEVGV